MGDRALHLVVLGYGYSARRVGARCLAAGWQVTGTSRSAAKLRGLETAGVRGLQVDLASGDSGEWDRLAAALASATHLLVSFPPGPETELVPSPLREALASGPGGGSLRWIGLLSTTGVYGDTGGAWVDEGTEPRPGLARTRLRLAYEEAWSRLADGVGAPLQIFRIAGIYGPGRSPLDRVRSGKARRIVKAGSVFNRIHVDDIAGAVLAGMSRPGATGVFNLADGSPASSHEVLTHAADLLGVEAPPEVSYEEADLSPMAESFFAEDRRVRSRRLTEDLGYRLIHASYREGLQALLEEESP